MKILTSQNDDFLYQRIINLLQQIKLVRGGTDLAYTLRNHPKIRNYCREKQVQEIKDIEDKYFFSDGCLNTEIIEIEFEKRSFQNDNINVKFN